MTKLNLLLLWLSLKSTVRSNEPAIGSSLATDAIDDPKQMV